MSTRRAVNRDTTYTYVTRVHRFIPVGVSTRINLSGTFSFLPPFSLIVRSKTYGNIIKRPRSSKTNKCLDRARVCTDIVFPYLPHNITHVVALLSPDVFALSHSKVSSESIATGALWFLFSGIPECFRHGFRVRSRDYLSPSFLMYSTWWSCIYDLGRNNDLIEFLRFSKTAKTTITRAG